MSIATQGMIVSLHMGAWEGFKFDKEISNELIRNKGAKDGSARVNKSLVDRDVLKETRAAKAAIYTHFQDHTLPWKSNGDRVLLRKMYPLFIETHAKLVEDFKASIDHLVKVKYPNARDQAAFTLAAMFKEEDYPHPSELRSKFYVSLEIDAVTEAGDFRCAVQSEEADKIKAGIEKAMSERLNAAQADIWDRVAKAVDHYRERMADTSDGARLFESTKENLFALIDVLPGLNIMDDPKLKEIGREVAARLRSFEISDLRKKRELKAQAASEAQAVVDKIKAHMATFTQSSAMDDDDE